MIASFSVRRGKSCCAPPTILRPNLPYGIPLRLVSRFIAIAAEKFAKACPAQSLAFADLGKDGGGDAGLHAAAVQAAQGDHILPGGVLLDAPVEHVPGRHKVYPVL